MTVSEEPRKNKIKKHHGQLIKHIIIVYCCWIARCSPSLFNISYVTFIQATWSWWDLVFFNFKMVSSKLRQYSNVFMKFLFFISNLFIWFSWRFMHIVVCKKEFFLKKNSSLLFIVACFCLKIYEENNQ